MKLDNGTYLSLCYFCAHVLPLHFTARMDSTSASHFGFIAGVLGFVLAVTTASACCRSCFPSVQMKILDELLRETQQLYEQADAEKLFPSDFFRKISKSMLVRCVKKSILYFSSVLLAHKVWNNAPTHFAKALTMRQLSFSNLLLFLMGFHYTSCSYRIVSRNSGLACMLVFFIDSLPEHNDSFHRPPSR